MFLSFVLRFASLKYSCEKIWIKKVKIDLRTMYLKLKTQIINIEVLSAPPEEILEWSGKIRCYLETCEISLSYF